VSERTKHPGNPETGPDIPTVALRMSKDGLPLSMSKSIFWISIFSPLDTDNFTARDPCTWRWREETRVIPYALEPDTAAQPQPGQHLGSAQSSFSKALVITLVSSLQRQVYGSFAVKLSIPRDENRKSKKVPLVLDTTQEWRNRSLSFFLWW